MTPLLLTRRPNSTLVLESFGHIGDEAVQLVRILAQEAAFNGIAEEDAFFHRAISRLSFALQRGNKKMESDMWPWK